LLNEFINRVTELAAAARYRDPQDTFRVDENRFPSS